MEEYMKALLENSPWLIVLFLSTVNERIIEATVKKAFERFNVDSWWLIPTSWVTGLALGLLSTLNLFVGVFRWDVVGWILTAILIGGGSNLIHEIYGGANALKELLRVRANGNDS